MIGSNKTKIGLKGELYQFLKEFGIFCSNKTKIGLKEKMNRTRYGFYVGKARIRLR